MSAKRYHQRSAEGFVLWGLFLCVGLGFGLCAIGLLTLFKTVNPFRCCPPLWNYGSAVMYGRLYEVGNSLRLLFNCGCSMVQITFRWKIAQRRISQTQIRYSGYSTESFCKKTTSVWNFDAKEKPTILLPISVFGLVEGGRRQFCASFQIMRPRPIFKSPSNADSNLEFFFSVLCLTCYTYTHIWVIF